MAAWFCFAVLVVVALMALAVAIRAGIKFYRDAMRELDELAERIAHPFKEHR